MATIVKCTEQDGKTIYVNFDHVRTIKPLAPTEKNPHRTELMFAIPDASARIVIVIDDPDSLARSTRA